MSTTHKALSRFLSVFLIGAMVVSGFGLSSEAEAASKPSIKLTAPSAKSSFAKEGSGIIPIAWSAKSVPENTVVIIELEQKKPARSTVGGGTWQGQIDAGDSTGSYNWDIEGEGRAGVGSYRVRAYLRECARAGCSQGPTTSELKNLKVYAKSKWTNIKITKSARGESEEAAETVGARPSGPVAVSLSMDGSNGDFFNLSADSKPRFNYYPSGDVESCTINAYYQGGKQTQTHGWKNTIKPDQYGTFTFNAVGPYPFKSLQSVEVICGNANYRASDTIRFAVDASAPEADFKILTGNSGQRTYKKGTGTNADAKSYCSQAYNDPKIHKYTRVQCYWNGNKFEDVREFKG